MSVVELVAPASPISEIISPACKSNSPTNEAKGPTATKPEIGLWVPPRKIVIAVVASPPVASNNNVIDVTRLTVLAGTVVKPTPEATTRPSTVTVNPDFCEIFNAVLVPTEVIHLLIISFEP